MKYNEQSRARASYWIALCQTLTFTRYVTQRTFLLNDCQFISLIDCEITDRLIRYWSPITIQFEKKNKHELFIEPPFYFVESSPYCNYELPLNFSRGRRSCGKLNQLHRQTESDRLLCSRTLDSCLYIVGAWNRCAKRNPTGSLGYPHFT
jgi:hypothetical protein